MRSASPSTAATTAPKDSPAAAPSSASVAALSPPSPAVAAVVAVGPSSSSSAPPGSPRLGREASIAARAPGARPPGFNRASRCRRRGRASTARSKAASGSELKYTLSRSSAGSAATRPSRLTRPHLETSAWTALRTDAGASQHEETASRARLPRRTNVPPDEAVGASLSVAVAMANVRDIVAQRRTTSKTQKETKKTIETAVHVCRWHVLQHAHIRSVSYFRASAHGLH